MKHICFISGYCIYFLTFLFSGEKLIYPLYTAPFVIYAVLAGFSLMHSRIMRSDFLKSMRFFEPALYIFILLIGTPFFLNASLPEPHNFALRKLELFLGMIYACFIAVLIIRTVRSFLKEKIFETEDLSRVFKMIVVFFAAVYISMSMWFNYANQPTGDEPIYLMVSHSILYDFDLDLKNNYEHKDYSRFYKKELESHELSINGRIISYHPVWFSVIIAPFYLILLRLGVTLFINIAAAFLCGFIFLFLEKSGIKRKNSIVTAGITGLSMPVFMYFNQITTEVISAVLITGALTQIIYYKKRWLPGGFACFMVFLMHLRNIPVIAAIIIIAFIEYRKEIITFVKYAALQAGGAVILFLGNYFIYGVLVPRQSKEEIPVNRAFTFNSDGFLGLFLDQEFGILFYTPVFSVIFAGLFFMHSRDKKLFYYMLLIFLPVYIMSAMWFEWRGGGGSSPRFFVPVILFFSVSAAFAVDKLKSIRARNVFYTLAGAGLAVSFVISLVPWFRWNKGKGENWILKFISEFINVDITVLFPALWGGGSSAAVIIWIFMLIFVNIYMISADRHRI